MSSKNSGEKKAPNVPVKKPGLAQDSAVRRLNESRLDNIKRGGNVNNTVPAPTKPGKTGNDKKQGG